MTSWFFKGLIVDRETRTTLYEVMDVSPKATGEEIRSAYRRQAVHLHPDKVRQRGEDVTSSSVAKFQRLKEAYDVLSNKERRKIYDEYGEGGLKLIEDPSAVTNSIEILFKNFVTMRNRDRLKLWLFVSIFVGSLLLSPILYCVKIDGHINDAKWTAIATPLWFYDAIILLFLTLSVLAGKTPRPEHEEGNNWTDPSPLKWRIHALLCWYLIVAQELMVTMRMDYFTDISWSYNFFVWYAFEAVLWIRVFPRMFQKLPTMPSLNGDEEDGTTEEREYFELLIARKEAEADKRKAIESFIWSLCRIIQLIMLGLKLDNECKWGWWAIFWPTYVACGSALLRIVLQYMIAKKYLAYAKELQGSQDESVPPKDNDLAVMYMTDAISGAFIMVLIVFMVFMAIGHIAGADYSSFLILLPVFILSGCIMCCTTCVICCFHADAKDLDDIIGAGTSMPRSDDLEQWDSDEPSEYYPPSSYGTYVPPTMLTVDTDDAPVTLNPSGGGATGGGVLPRRAPADID